MFDGVDAVGELVVHKPVVIKLVVDDPTVVKVEWVG